MIIDTHVHYDDEQFDTDRETLLASLRAHHIGYVIDVGSTPESLPKVMSLVHQYDFTYGAVGIHPDEVGSITPELWKEIEEDLSDPKIAAVGEIGLDYYWNKESRGIQTAWFKKQIELAQKHNKPILIHSRNAAEDTLRVIEACYGTGINPHPGIVHCYSYSPEMAEIYVKMGFMLGIGGVVTYRNSKKLRETVAQTDLSHLVLETDCPYLAPEQMRGTRNSSLNLPYVISEIAKLKNCSEDEVINTTEDNAKQLFGLPEGRCLS